MHEEHEHEHEEEVSLSKIIITAILFILSLVIKNFPLEKIIPAIQNIENLQKYLYVAVCLLAFILIGKNTLKEAIENLLKGEFFDETFLMSLASISAVCIGQLSEAVAIMLFYQLGEFFEDFTVDKTEDSINSLVDIRPDTATIIKNGKEESINANEVKIGDKIIVKAGERLPVDGIILKGKSFIDNSALTGESVPLEVFEGVKVFSGAINQTGLLEIEASQIASESAASRIIKLVEFSSEKKTKTENFITRFSKIYTPIVCILALGITFIPTLVIALTKGNWDLAPWIYRGISFLVVSCPCAVVISVPLAFLCGIGSASRNGILIKGSINLDNLSRTKTAVFDKTGTLTKGVFEVTEIAPADNSISPEELLALAAHAEAKSNHPVAKSLNTAHSGECCKKQNLTDTEEIAGHGIKALLNGKKILAGNSKLMESNNVSGFNTSLENNKNGTIVHVCENEKYLGHIIISDKIKDDAKSAVKKLRKLGISKIVMLTGDNKNAAEKIAEELNINEVYPELLPQDKVNKLEILMNEAEKSKGKVIFAGDGINDAPVLARADVGIAMGALGSDAAIESADVVIMTDEPSKVAKSVKISRKTKSIVLQNIFFSIGIKGLIMILSGIGLTSMWLAVFGDVGVSILAILNSTRALKE